MMSGSQGPRSDVGLLITDTWKCSSSLKNFFFQVAATCRVVQRFTEFDRLWLNMSDLGICTSGERILTLDTEIQPRRFYP